MSDQTTECPNCHEVHPFSALRCARCGRSLESDEQRTVRLAALERGRREAERENANYPRLRRTGSFSMARSVDTMSDQRLRRIVFTLTVIGLVVLVLSVVR